MYNGCHQAKINHEKNKNARGHCAGRSFLTLPLTSRAGDTNSAASTPPKPDKLTTCPVSGEKLGEMGKPYVFVYKGQEVKLCCPGCKKDFD